MSETKLAEVAYINSVATDEDDSDDVDPQGSKIHFRMLGQNKGTYYFMAAGSRQVTEFAPSALASKPNLFTLAPLHWWEREFPGDSGFKGAQVDMAANWLIQTCYSKGLFSDEKRRGRGAWWDEGRSVIHVGDSLLVDGERVDVDQIESEFVYEALPSINVNMDTPASDDEARKLLTVCTSLNWENPIYGRLMAGWIVSALACGALDWRPHCITTGPSGCGKSWVAENIVNNVLGHFGLAAKGESSEAGIRQTLEHDALPVIFDEAEGDDKRTAAAMDRILGLMRQSSAEVGGKILKGGGDGKAQSFTIRSAFHLFAIRVPMQQTADENRVTVLTLLRNQPDDRRRFQEYVAPLAEEMQRPGWAANLRARVFGNIKVLRHNANVFAQAFSEVFNARIGDQYGAMMAGAWLLGTTDEITLDRAKQKVRDIDSLLNDARELNDESDEDKLISTITSLQINVDSGKTKYTRSVGELLELCDGKRNDDIFPGDAISAMDRCGIMVRRSVVYIANNHGTLAGLMLNTSWPRGWATILKRIDGARACTPKKFAGTSSRSVSIPIEALIGIGDNEYDN